MYSTSTAYATCRALAHRHGKPVAALLILVGSATATTAALSSPNRSLHSVQEKSCSLTCQSWPDTCENSVTHDNQRTLCDSAKSSSGSQGISPPPLDPSWFRLSMYRIGIIRSLPLPRRLHPNDPDLQVSSRLLRQRARDSIKIQNLQQRLADAVHSRNTEKAQSLVTQVYETLYGPGITPQERTEFLIHFGCTGWNEQILETLAVLGANRGFVEVGAGHGQWARVLQDHRQAQWEGDAASETSHDKHSQSLPHPRTLVRAYDNGSHLPLNPKVYHSQTKPFRAYFGNVMNCPDVASVLAQFENRGRILLLVYPPPDDSLAVDALQAYTAVHPRNDTLVYVGEGRGGANANDDFFDALTHADNPWYLIEILPGVPCGSKGEENVYIFRKQSRNS